MTTDRLRIPKTSAKPKISFTIKSKKNNISSFLTKDTKKKQKIETKKQTRKKISEKPKNYEKIARKRKKENTKKSNREKSLERYNLQKIENSEYRSISASEEGEIPIKKQIQQKSRKKSVSAIKSKKKSHHKSENKDRLLKRDHYNDRYKSRQNPINRHYKTDRKKYVDERIRKNQKRQFHQRNRSYYRSRSRSNSRFKLKSKTSNDKFHQNDRIRKNGKCRKDILEPKTKRIKIESKNDENFKNDKIEKISKNDKIEKISKNDKNEKIGVKKVDFQEKNFLQNLKLEQIKNKIKQIEQMKIAGKSQIGNKLRLEFRQNKSLDNNRSRKAVEIASEIFRTKKANKKKNLEDLPKISESKFVLTFDFDKVVEKVPKIWYFNRNDDREYRNSEIELPIYEKLKKEENAKKDKNKKIGKEKEREKAETTEDIKHCYEPNLPNHLDYRVVFEKVWGENSYAGKSIVDVRKIAFKEKI